MLFPMIGMADSPPGSKNNRGGRQVHVRAERQECVQHINDAGVSLVHVLSQLCLW